MKQKEFVGIIKSGLVGAFALTSLLFFLTITFAGPQTLGSLFGAVFKVVPLMPGIFITFIIFGAIGFVLGVVLGRFFPMIQKRTSPLIIAFVVLALPFGFIAWIYYQATLHVEYPARELKLANCTNNVVNFHFNAPRGHDHLLELRISGMSSYDVSGHMRVLSDGSLLADMHIGSDRTWRSGDGYVLTIVGLQSTNVLPLSKLVQSHKDYDFEITLDSKPPTNASIWMEWWESRIDK